MDRDADIAERMRAAATNSALDIGTAWTLLDEGADEIAALRSMVDQQNAALNDAASEIERLSTALAVTLESLDQIGAMTKQSRASVNARSAVVFVRTQLESTK